MRIRERGSRNLKSVMLKSVAISEGSLARAYHGNPRCEQIITPDPPMVSNDLLSSLEFHRTAATCNAYAVRNCRRIHCHAM